MKMFTYAIRISHDVAQAYQDAMAMTFKDFQVTSINLIGHFYKEFGLVRNLYLHSMTFWAYVSSLSYAFSDDWEPVWQFCTLFLNFAQFSIRLVP